ncbi:MAG: SUMF1/EgtB/PvdO family nonheme iron enzyme [Polyangiaceae bacterium]
MTDPFSLRPGDTFADDFVVVRDVSRGGMGAVYQVKQISTDRPRALKVMLPEVVGDAGLRKRFEQEARIGARIDSDHVVEVVAAGIEPESGVPWLAMELLEGHDLATELRERKHLGADEVLSIFEKICHAVGAAHRVGIVHRDLKPENIFLAKTRRVGETYTVKVLDFGLAKLLAEAKTRRTAAVGSPKWMAPEQTDGSEVSPETDVWALGLIAFRLLTGAYYWVSANSEDVTLPQLMREILFEDLPRASVRAADLGGAAPLSAGFDEWFQHCVTRSRAARFANADIALERLRAVLSPAVPSIAQLGPVADSPRPPASPSQPSLAGAESGSTGPATSQRTSEAVRSRSLRAAAIAQPSEKRPKPQRRDRRWIPVTVGLGALAIGGAGTWAAVRIASGQFGGPPKAPTPASSAAPVAVPKPGVSARSAPNQCPPGMALMPRGTYVMGERKDIVSIQPFCIDTTEVTGAAYGTCVAASACSEPSPHKTEDPSKYYRACNWKRPGAALHPVNCVDWNQATTYCSWAGKRLPSEEEWEWAARSADAARPYPWGDAAPSADRVNACGPECVRWAKDNLGEEWSPTYPMDDGWPTTAPVGSFPHGATEQGLEDMAGNVWEWTSSPLDAGTRVVRGGGWGFDLATRMHTAFRGGREPSLRSKFVGFRCAR